MKILSFVRSIAEFGKTTKEKQRNINVSEVFHLWNHLIQRYNVIYITNILENYAKDGDLKLVLKVGKVTLGKHVMLLENEMTTYGIPLPIRPPKQIQITAKLEEISDRYIFRRILRGIQSFLPTHTMAFIHSTSPKIREQFKTFMIQEMDLYDKFIEYGKVKGYEINPPAYKA